MFCKGVFHKLKKICCVGGCFQFFTEKELYGTTSVIIWLQFETSVVSFNWSESCKGYAFICEKTSSKISKLKSTIWLWTSFDSGTNSSFFLVPFPRIDVVMWFNKLFCNRMRFHILRYFKHHLVSSRHAAMVCRQIQNTKLEGLHENQNRVFYLAKIFHHGPHWFRHVCCQSVLARQQGNFPPKFWKLFNVRHKIKLHHFCTLKISAGCGPGSYSLDGFKFALEKHFYSDLAASSYGQSGENAMKNEKREGLFR